MTMQTCGLMYWPPQLFPETVNSAFGTNNITFDSSTDRLAWAGVSPLTDTLTKVHFRTGTVTTGAVLDVRIETVSNGVPTGTLFGTNTNGSVTVADGDDGVWKTATLTSAASLSAGDQFAIVIVYTSGSPSIAFLSVGLAGAQAARIPVVLQDTGGGTWAALTSTWLAFAEFGTAGPQYLPRLAPMDGSTTITAFNNSSTPDEYALKIVPAFKARVVGLRSYIFNPAAGGDFTVSLWPGTSSVDGDALGQESIDGDMGQSTSQDGAVDVFFASPVTLTAGSTYYIGLRADTANNVSVGRISTPSGITGSQKALLLNSTSHVEASRSWTAGSAGAWTEDANKFIPFSLIIDQIDDGAGGGTADYQLGV